MGEYDLAIAIGTILGAVVTAVMVVFIAVTYGKQAEAVSDQKTQSQIQNFEMISKYLRSKETRDERHIVYQNANKIGMLLQNYEIIVNFRNEYNEQREQFNKQTLEELEKLNEASWGVIATYDRIAHIISKDEHIRKWFIDYHGFVMGKMFVLLDCIMTRRTELYGGLGYPEFKRIFCEQLHDRYEKMIVESFQKTNISIFDECGNPITFNS